MKLVLENIEVTGESRPGWVRQKITRRFEADWETGAAHFKRLGYANWLTLPATIIPMTFNREKVLEFYADAVVAIVFAEATTCNQPRSWKGEVQIPEALRKNEWCEIIEQEVFRPT